MAQSILKETAERRGGGGGRVHMPRAVKKTCQHSFPLQDCLESHAMRCEMQTDCRGFRLTSRCNNNSSIYERRNEGTNEPGNEVRRAGVHALWMRTGRSEPAGARSPSPSPYMPMSIWMATAIMIRLMRGNQPVVPSPVCVVWLGTGVFFSFQFFLGVFLFFRQSRIISCVLLLLL